MLSLFSCFMYSVLNSFFGLSARTLTHTLIMSAIWLCCVLYAVSVQLFHVLSAQLFLRAQCSYVNPRINYVCHLVVLCFVCCHCSAVSCTKCSTLSSGSVPASQWMCCSDSTYLTEITPSCSSSCSGKEIVTHSICILLQGYYICYMNSKHVQFVLLLWVRFLYRELLFWVIMQQVVVITTTGCVII